MSLVAPFGAFLTQFDTAVTTAQSTAVSGLSSAMTAPLASMAVIYFAFMGWRVARGDLAQVHDFTIHMAKIGFIFYLATNATNFNKWVVQTYEMGIPSAITQAIAGSGTSSTMGTVSGVGTALDAQWALIWQMSSNAWTQAGILDVSTRVIAALSAIGGGIGLLLCAGVYMISRFLFAIVIVLGPVAIACAMFSSTRPIFERWIGKGVAMIVLQVTAVATMQIVIAGDIKFMTPLANASNLDLPHQLQGLISIVMWQGLGAFAIYSLPALAYSIGTGVAVSMLPVAIAAVASAKVAGSAAGAMAGALSGGSSSSSPDYNLSLARAELGGPSSDGSLAPPPPPALPYASPPLLTYEG